MDATAVSASSTYDALCGEFTTEANALCGALNSETPASLVDHMARIFPADDLVTLIEELGSALQETPPKPAFLEVLREELSASSGESAATVADDPRFDEACQRAQDYVQRLSEAHYVDSSELGIPRAEQDADGELLLGVCRRCQATRLLSSLEEHEASCRPEPERARQASPAAVPLPAAHEGQASLSQGNPAPRKRAQPKGSVGRPPKRPRPELLLPAAVAEPAGSLPGSAAPWAAQPPAKRLPPLHPGMATGSNAQQPGQDGPQQHPAVPASSTPAARPKPVVKLKQPSVAKSSSPAAALNAAWANFPMPTEFMAEEPGSFRMDWLSSADLGAAPAAASAAGATGQLAAKAAAKAGAKAAATAQKLAAKKAAKKRRALAAAPNRRLGLFQPFTMHPRRKRSDTFKRIPRTSPKAFVQQPGAFAEVIASLAGDSPSQPQLQRQASKPRPRPSAPQGPKTAGVEMRQTTAHASLNALSAMPSLDSDRQPPQVVNHAANVPAGPARQAQTEQPQVGQPQGRQPHPGARQQARPYIPQSVLQQAQEQRSAEPIREYLRRVLQEQRGRQAQEMLRRQQLAGQGSLGSPQRAGVAPQAQHPAASAPPAALLGVRPHASQQPWQLPAPAGSMIPISTQPQAQHLAGPHLRYGASSQPHASHSPSRPHGQPVLPQAQSAQQQEALRAMYMQRTGHPHQATNGSASHASGPLRRMAMQHQYPGMAAPAQSSNPMSTVTSSQGYRQPMLQNGSPYTGSASAMLGHPQNTAMSGRHPYVHSTPPAASAAVPQAPAVPGVHAGQQVSSFQQQQQQQQQYTHQLQQRYFASQQQQGSGTMQYYQPQQAAVPPYLSNGSSGLGLANGVQPLKGSRLGAAAQAEASQAMRWIPTGVAPPTDKLASVQQLNPIPGARPDDSLQPMLGQYSFPY